MLDLVGNPEDRFSHNEAHMYKSRLSIIESQVNGPMKAKLYVYFKFLCTKVLSHLSVVTIIFMK